MPTTTFDAMRAVTSAAFTHATSRRTGRLTEVDILGGLVSDPATADVLERFGLIETARACLARTQQEHGEVDVSHPVVDQAVERFIGWVEGAVALGGVDVVRPEQVVAAACRPTSSLLAMLRATAADPERFDAALADLRHAARA